MFYHDTTVSLKTSPFIMEMKGMVQGKPDVTGPQAHRVLRTWKKPMK